jgi:hypothetical protein
MTATPPGTSDALGKAYSTGELSNNNEVSSKTKSLCIQLDPG